MSRTPRPSPARIARLGVVVGLGLLAAACTSSPPDGGSGDTAGAESARSRDDETGTDSSGDGDCAGTDSIGDGADCLCRSRCWA